LHGGERFSEVSIKTDVISGTEAEMVATRQKPHRNRLDADVRPEAEADRRGERGSDPGTWGGEQSL